MQRKDITKAFSIFNGGKGLDHWSYSSTSTPFAKNLINYTFPQNVRRTFPFRYKANFGNLVNNTVLWLNLYNNNNDLNLVAHTLMQVQIDCLYRT